MAERRLLSLLQAPSPGQERPLYASLDREKKDSEKKAKTGGLKHSQTFSRVLMIPNSVPGLFESRSYHDDCSLVPPPDSPSIPSNS